MIRVLVVDDHRLVRSGTARLLEDIDGIEVAGQAGSGEEAIEKISCLSPDVVLMDMQMPGIGGLEATRRCLRIAPAVKIIAVSVLEREPCPAKLIKLGAVGYITKRVDVNEMNKAIRKVMLGQRYISADIAQQMALNPMYSEDTKPFDLLSNRELQITLMVVAGHRVPQISIDLSLSPKTVNSYRYRIFEKLNLNSDVSLTKLAIKHGVIDAEAVV